MKVPCWYYLHSWLVFEEKNLCIFCDDVWLFYCSRLINLAARAFFFFLLHVSELARLSKSSINGQQADTGQPTLNLQFTVVEIK